ncbi:hypothetical protein D3C71_1936310 [compost metagenome]
MPATFVFLENLNNVVMHFNHRGVRMNLESQDCHIFTELNSRSMEIVAISMHVSFDDSLQEMCNFFICVCSLFSICIKISEVVLGPEIQITRHIAFEILIQRNLFHSYNFFC